MGARYRINITKMGNNTSTVRANVQRVNQTSSLINQIYESPEPSLTRAGFHSM